MEDDATCDSLRNERIRFEKSQSKRLFPCSKLTPSVPCMVPISSAWPACLFWARSRSISLAISPVHRNLFDVRRKHQSAPSCRHRRLRERWNSGRKGFGESRKSVTKVVSSATMAGKRLHGLNLKLSSASFPPAPDPLYPSIILRSSCSLHSHLVYYRIALPDLPYRATLMVILHLDCHVTANSLQLRTNREQTGNHGDHATLPHP